MFSTRIYLCNLCGIVGVVRLADDTRAVKMGQILTGCLEKLEYRGYDSVGIAVISNRELVVRKGKGKIAEVAPVKGFALVDGPVGIGHTRWATHGVPNDTNAHPHTDCTGTIAVIHNGIITNFSELKHELKAEGHAFKSDTDTEVFSHLFESSLEKFPDPFVAFRESVRRIRGSYSIVALTISDPERIFFARKNTPLVLGFSETMLFVASDIPAFLDYTRRVGVVFDGEIGYISSANKAVLQSTADGGEIDAHGRSKVIFWNAEQAKKGGYPHYMIKEIHEQPAALADTISQALVDVSLEKAAEILASSRNVYFVGAGTAYHAALAGRDALLTYAERSSNCVVSSEYQLFSRSSDKRDVAIIISQSGETIDSLMALRAFKDRGVRTIALSNILESAIPRESDIAVYTRAGPEIGVAATKTFLTQVAVLQIVAEKVGVITGRVDVNENLAFRRSLESLPRLVEENISVSEFRARELARVLATKQSIYYLSRGMGVPLAKEGALKIKEVAYIHAEAYEAGESKHGPIALVSNGFPVLFVFSDESAFHELESNLMEMKSRGAYTIGLVDGKHPVDGLDYSISLESQKPELNTIAFAPALQFLAYFTALQRRLDPDKPRNLAKTVTVE
jgi:glucosamine--fructose-6-phosphate aminotransferase (isomerizing)